MITYVWNDWHLCCYLLTDTVMKSLFTLCRFSRRQTEKKHFPIDQSVYWQNPNSLLYQYSQSNQLTPIISNSHWTFVIVLSCRRIHWYSLKCGAAQWCTSCWYHDQTHLSFSEVKIICITFTFFLLSLFRLILHCTQSNSTVFSEWF